MVKRDLSYGKVNIGAVESRRGHLSVKSAAKHSFKEIQRSSPQYNGKAPITDQQFDQFTGFMEFPAQSEFFSSIPPMEALIMKKQNRQDRAQKRRERLLNHQQKESITAVAKPSPLDLQIKIPNKKELNRHKSSSPQKRRDISQQQKAPIKLQLTPNIDKSNNKYQQGKNRANSPQKGNGAQASQNSQFTMSSVKIVEYESNSIISEEDSAFEDFSPRNQRRNKKRIEQQTESQTKGNEEPQRLKGPMANEIITGNRNFKNTEPTGITIGPLGQEHSDRNHSNKGPPKRSTTQNTKNKEQNKQTPMNKSRKKHIKKNHSRNNDEKKSRDSSFNMMSDNHYDQMSMNFGTYGGGAKKFVKKTQTTSKKQGISNRTNHNESQHETNSVRSVITGTKHFNFFGGHKKSFDGDMQHKMKATSQSSQRRHEKVIAQSKEQFNDNDSMRQAQVRKSRKVNEKIVNVYLQTPYKVNSYNEIKSSLYRAENNLKICTCHPHRKFIDRNTSNEEEKFKNMMTNSKNEQLGVGNSNNKINRLIDKSYELNHSVISDLDNGHTSLRTHNGLVNESVFNTARTLKHDMVQKPTKFLNSHHRKMLKDHENRLQSTMREAVFEQLAQKLDKKIENVNNQNKQLVKQNQLFTIYGSKDNNWYNPNNSLHKTLVNEMMSSSMIFEEDGNENNNTQPTPHQTMQVNPDIAQQHQLRCGTSNILKEINKVNPYLPDSLKSRKKAIKEIEACLHSTPPKTTPVNKKLGKTLKEKQKSPITIEDNVENISELIDKSKTMGFSKVKMNQILQKQEVLALAERTLEEQLSQVKSGLTTSINFFKDGNENPKDNIHILSGNNQDITDFRKSQEQAFSQTKQLQSKTIVEENQRISRSIKKKAIMTIDYDFQSLSKDSGRAPTKVNTRSTENKEKVQFYFDSKKDIKRSILKQENKSYAQMNQKMQQQQLENNMIHAISDDKKSIKLKSKFVDQKIKTDRTYNKRSSEKKTNFVLNNIKNTVLPQILNQYNNGSKIKKFDYNVTSDNDNEGESISMKRSRNKNDQSKMMSQTGEILNPFSLPNFHENQKHEFNENQNIIAQSKSRGDGQRLSYNSNILSYSSAEMIANFPISNTSRAQEKTLKQQQTNSPIIYKKSITQNEKGANKKLKPYDITQVTKNRSGLDISPHEGHKTSKDVQPESKQINMTTLADKRNVRMNEAYNISNFGKPMQINLNPLSTKHSKALPYDRSKFNNEGIDRQKSSQTRRNASNERSQKKSNYGHFYNEKFTNSEQTAILKTCFDKKRELQKMLSGVKQMKPQQKRTIATSGLPQISSSINFAPTQ